MKVFIKDCFWTRSNGRIPAGMKVSHQDGNPENNTEENLILVPESEYPGDKGQYWYNGKPEDIEEEAAAWSARDKGAIGEFDSELTRALAIDLCGRCYGFDDPIFSDADFKKLLPRHRESILAGLSKHIPPPIRKAMLKQLDGSRAKPRRKQRAAR